MRNARGVNFYSFPILAYESAFGNRFCLALSAFSPQCGENAPLSTRAPRGSSMGIPSLCHPEPCEGSLSEYCQDLNRDPSKAREDLPCLQRVKRARRNRRHMGVCPWQLVAESASFSAADYRAQASGEIFGKLPQELFTVCLATLTAYSPRAAGQRPVRLAAVPSRRLAQGDTIVTFCHPEPCEGSLSEYRQDLNRDPSTSLRFAQDDNEGESHFSIIQLRVAK